MATTFKTPGVYVKEIQLLPPSVAQVETAIPAFIGYTEFHSDDKGNSLKEKPKRIKSLLEFETYFGKGYTTIEDDGKTYFKNIFTVKVDSGSKTTDSVAPDKIFYLYDCMRQFYDNGGGPCYIVSVGTFADAIEFGSLSKGLSVLAKVDEPTLLLFPDAVLLSDPVDFGNLQKDALRQCAVLQDRFTIMDLIEKVDDPVSIFRQNIGINNLSYGAAYFPWVKTTYSYEVMLSKLNFINKADSTPIVMETLLAEDSVFKLYKKKTDNRDAIDIKLAQLEGGDLTIGAHLEKLKQEIAGADGEDDVLEENYSNYMKTLAALANFFPFMEDSASDDLLRVIKTLKNDKSLTDAIAGLIAFDKNAKAINFNTDERNTAVLIAPDYNKIDVAHKAWAGGKIFSDIAASAIVLDDQEQGVLIDAIEAAKIPDKLITAFNTLLAEASNLALLATTALLKSQPIYKTAVDKINDFMCTIPCSATIAGIYAAIDRTRGVWKAPANVSINSIVGPTIKIDNSDQDDLNVHSTGKSINAIRTFTGKGTLVWGSRTLAGNDNEWRYVPVRRFFNMVEESTKKASEPFVFENNDANTWVKIQAMIENFLILQWRAGALQGAKTAEAFFVSVGLGKTMTELDILEGRLIVEIGMAVVRPAEFIILRFSHKMLSSNA